jgi:hypothetical protein
LRHETSVEQNLIAELNNLNIKCVSEFKLGAGKGEEFRADLMITFPTRAIVEVKNFFNENTNNATMEKLLTTFDAINRRYFGTLDFFVIDLSGNMDTSLVLEEKIKVIHVPKGEQDIALYCAKEIEKKIFKSYPLGTKKSSLNPVSKTDYFDLFNINISKFEQVLISLRAYIEPEEYKMVVSEVSELNSEITSNHYTSAALRIGRTVEYIVYTLALAWDVKINRLSSSIVDDLEQSNIQLKKLIIDYFYSSEEEKTKRKKNLKQKCQQLSNKIITLGFEIDSLDEPKETNQPINLQTIIRDIKRKYAHIKEAREIIDSILDDGSLQVLLQMRNSAAHARILDNHQDIDSKKIDLMIGHLQFIIFNLVSLAAIIQKNKS